jgi:S1-C subfamily serine protease
MRAGGIAVVALVAAALGSTGALVVARTPGWVGDGGVRTVVVSTVTTEAGPGAPATELQVGNRFDPARIYASRSPGVVTIYASFGEGERTQGSGFVASDAGHILTNSHVVTNAGEGATVHGASSTTRAS